MLFKRYFHIQQLCFALCGIDTTATKPEHIVKRPLLFFVTLFFAIAHVVAIIHYAYANRHDYIEVTDSLALSCQSLLAIWKMFIFWWKRGEFVELITELHVNNSKASGHELNIIRSKNTKDDTYSTRYFWTVLCAAILAFSNPILEAFYSYFTTGELVLRVPYKASYFWSHSQLPGYSLVYLWNCLSIYNLFGITIAIDTLFTWIVSNILAQFDILRYRFREAAKICNESKSMANTEARKFLKAIKPCIEYHYKNLQLVEKLNRVYGEIIFIKFLISCTEICCLVFRLSRPSESTAVALYQCVFLLTVALQLIMYCYNGQRIRDESLQVAPEIFFAFDWSHLAKSCKKILLLPMMRSQITSQLKGVFFVVDLTLYLWVFKTAGSLITALKTLDENQA